MKKFILSILLACFILPFARAENRHVVLVIIDGARYSETLGDTSGQYIPNMKRLALQGAVLDSFINDSVTYTNRAVPAIWSGSWTAPRDTSYYFKSNWISTQYAQVPSLWEYFRKAKSVDSTQAFYFIKWLSTPWLPSFTSQYGREYWPYYTLQGTRDLDVWNSCKSYLQTYHPQLSVLYLCDVDHYGHTGDWDQYTSAITMADSIVGMLWDFVQSDATFRDATTVLVTNDHGRHTTYFNSHGDGCWGCRHIMFLGIGPAVKSGWHSSKKRSIPDIVPTIGAILDFPTPLVSGNIMTEMLAEQTAIPKTDSGKLPDRFLFDNFPNPFNPATTIRFQLTKPTHVRIQVFDLRGDQIVSLVKREMPDGIYEVDWNGRGNDDRPVSAGIYFYRITTDDGIYETNKMVFLP
ncbi:MAG: T9SS type A sorting domain-containing protein [archaeon]